MLFLRGLLRVQDRCIPQQSPPRHSHTASSSGAPYNCFISTAACAAGSDMKTDRTGWSRPQGSRTPFSGIITPVVEIKYSVAWDQIDRAVIQDVIAHLSTCAEGNYLSPQSWFLLRVSDKNLASVDEEALNITTPRCQGNRDKTALLRHVSRLCAADFLAFPWTHHVDAQVRGYTMYCVLMHAVCSRFVKTDVFYDSAVLMPYYIFAVCISLILARIYFF